MGSGLIYIIIVGMWIAYFLPRWIANHDEVSGRSVEKFALTMKVVGRTAGKAKIDIDEIKARRDQQILIRRILFVSIVGFTIITALFILVGFLSPAIMLIPISALGLFTVHARHQIGLINEELEMATLAPEDERYLHKYSELIARSKRIASTRIQVENEQWTPLSERVAKSETEAQGITIIPKGSAANKTWDPISVPPPSYANSSKAVASSRTNVKAVTEIDELQNFMKPSADEVFDQILADEAEARLKLNRAANE